MGEIWESKSEQDDAADRVQHEMDSHWGAFRREAEAVAANASAVANELNNRPGQRWQNPNESLREVQTAFLMRCFAMIDGLSQHVRGGKAWSDTYGVRLNKIRKKRRHQVEHRPDYPSAQTYRMMRFIQHYLEVPPTAARLSIEIYRHMLMHEGSVRGVLGRDEERVFTSYLSWQTDADSHFRVRPYISGKTTRQAAALVQAYGNDYPGVGWLVELGTLNLIADVEQAAARYAAHLRVSVPLYNAYKRLSDERWEGKLTWAPQV